MDEIAFFSVSTCKDKERTIQLIHRFYLNLTVYHSRKLTASTMQLAIDLHRSLRLLGTAIRPDSTLLDDD